MADFETRNIEQLPAATAVSPNALTVVQEPGGPAQKLAIHQLLGRLISTDAAKETRTLLYADLAFAANSIALVYGDGVPAQNGWYRKTGASGAGAWSQFEKLSAEAAAEVQPLVDQAASSAAAALAAAGVVSFASTAAGLAGTVLGGTFWVAAGDGTGITYRHDAGPVATQVGRFILDPTGSGTAALLGIIQSGDAQLRTVEAKAREIVSVNDFAGSSIETKLDKAIAALGSGGGDILFPRGTYAFGAELTITGKSDIRFVGQRALITGAGAALRSYFNMDGCSRIAFEGLRFDTRHASLATFSDYAGGPKEVPIRFRNGSELAVERCVFDKLYTRFIDLYNASNASILNNRFTSPLQSQNLILEFVAALTCGGSFNAGFNRFIGAATMVNGKSPCAITLSGVGGKFSIFQNYAEHCGRNNEGAHRLGVFDLYADGANVSVLHNRAVSCREQFMRLSTTQDALIEGNDVTIAVEADATYSSLSIESGSWPAAANAIVKRVKVSKNALRCLGNAQAFAIGVTSYDWGSGACDVELSDNFVQGHDRAFLLAGPFTNVGIRRNSGRGVNMLLDMTLEPAGVAPTTVLGSEATSRFDRLYIDDNDFEFVAGGAAIPVSISTNRAAQYTGTVGDFHFRRNALKRASSGTAFAVNVIFNASAEQGVFNAIGNIIDGFSTPFMLRSSRRATLRDNIASAVTTSFISTDGTVGLIEQYGNRRSAKGALRGSAVLVAGTVTVATTEIMAGDKVRVWREVRGGTIGADLVCDAANHVAGTSIRIDAIDTTGGTVTTDTSTVGWEIVGR